MKNNHKVQVGPGHRAKKSMGQNFLKSEAALRAMIVAGDVNDKDTILEIGPGKGALTEKLLESAGNVIAIEKDRDLMTILKEKFDQDIKNKKLILINDDILKFDPLKFGLKEGKYKIVANIPYNITGAIIKKFLSETIQPSAMILLVQKEVAQRIVASDGKESILSLSVKAYGTPKYIMKVGKRFFSPSPKVDSAIVSITDIHNVQVGPGQEGVESEKLFFDIIKAGFLHKRKMLKGNLASFASNSVLRDMFETLNIPDRSRSEDLPLDTWLAMTRYLSANLGK